MAEQSKKPAAATASPPTSLASEVFLQEHFEDSGLKKNYPFILIAVVLHLILFIITFPEIKYQIQAPKNNRKVMMVRRYTPPPPPQQQRKKIERKLIKKVPLPDPTPEEPEPIIEPEPEPDPPPIDPDVEILIGEPEPPPATGPLMPGIGGVTDPELIPETKVEPEFPELARRARIQGKVILQVVVRRDGTVGDIQVFKEPAANLGFSEAAINAVSQWRYHPARQNGKPVDVFITVVVNFTIE
ncbi:MAG TPA: energy transducer TonB [Acidobacteria bacterium]|nr:energy transducer TonB [Acidobacteriota bacterium]